MSTTKPSRSVKRLSVVRSYANVVLCMSQVARAVVGKSCGQKPFDCRASGAYSDKKRIVHRTLKSGPIFFLLTPRGRLDLNEDINNTAAALDVAGTDMVGVESAESAALDFDRSACSDASVEC